jgi:hypothetical protein
VAWAVCRLWEETAGGGGEGTLERRFHAFFESDLLVLDDFELKPLVAPARVPEAVTVRISANAAFAQGCLAYWQTGP